VRLGNHRRCPNSGCNRVSADIARARVLFLRNRPPIPHETPQGESIIMPTTSSSQNETENIVGFGADPQQRATLDISIYDLCDSNDHLAKLGTKSDGFELRGVRIPDHLEVGSADNPTSGTCFCSKVVSKFEGDATLSQEDYIHREGMRTNCWKLAGG
jgi:hypothetical protein